MEEQKQHSRKNSSYKVSAPNDKPSTKVSGSSRHNRNRNSIKPGFIGYRPKHRNKYSHTEKFLAKQELKNVIDVKSNNSVQNLNKDEAPTCLYCGKPLKKVNKKYPKTMTCNNSCRIKLRIKENIEVEGFKKSLVKKHNRLCRICGKPCWPNYFWHPHCRPHAYSIEDDYVR